MDIHNILDRASKLKIAVIGDLIQDNYLFGTVDRISPEAPVPVLLKQSTKTTMGGAGNVFMNLIGLGVDCELYCNYDGHPFWDYALLDKIHCNPYPFSKKTRIMCGNHQLLRVDEELSDIDMPALTIKQMSWWEKLMNDFPKYDAVVLADYGKGVLSSSVINTIMEYAQISKEEGKIVPIIVDAKKDFMRYQGSTILKCNKKEGVDGWIVRWPEAAEYRVVTHGEHGIVCNDSRGLIGAIDGYKINIVDTCGAGDTVTAMLSVGYVMRNDIHLLGMLNLANIAASEVCRHPGVFPIDKEHLIKRFNEIQNG